MVEYSNMHGNSVLIYMVIYKFTWYFINSHGSLQILMVLYIFTW